MFMGYDLGLPNPHSKNVICMHVWNAIAGSALLQFDWYIWAISGWLYDSSKSSCMAVVIAIPGYWILSVFEKKFPRYVCVLIW